MALAACAAFTGVTASPSVAATAPKPVTGVTVRGTEATSQVEISWEWPSDGDFAALVVVVRGPMPTSDPADARAVFSETVASPTTSVEWTGTPGDVYSVSVFAHDGTGFAAPATARASLPGPVRHLFVVSDGGEHAAYFTLPAQAQAAELCYRADRLPTSPGDAEDCSDPEATPSLRLDEDKGSRLFFAVFSIDVKTGAYGPGVSKGDGELPTTPNRVFDSAINATSLKFLWVHEALGGNDTAFVDTRKWEVVWAPGGKSPVGNTTARRILVPTSGDRLGNGYVRESYVAVRLTPGAAYTFAVRTVNALGEVGSWTLRTAATRIAGTHLVDSGGSNGALRSSRPPMPAQLGIDAEASLAVERNGTAHTAVYAYYGRPGTAVHGIRAPGAPWRKAAFPAGVSPRVRLASSTVTPGVIAIADGWCVRVRSARGTWKVAGCMEPPKPAADKDGWFDFDGAEIHGLELDKAGAVHVLYTPALSGRESHNLMYATNFSGRWAARRVSSSHASTGIAFTRDSVTDRLVLALGEFVADGRHQTRVASKAPAAAGFDTFSTWSNAPHTRAVVPASVASFGGQISVVGIRRSFGPTRGSWGSPVLLTGTSRAMARGMSAIPGARVDAEPRVAAVAAGRVLVAWSNLGFDTAEQGVWSIAGTYSAAGAPHWARRVRQSRSAYDVLHGLAVDRAGRSYVLVHRT